MKKIISYNLFFILTGLFFYLFLFPNYPIQVFLGKIFENIILIKEYILLTIILAYLTRKKFLKKKLYINKYLFYCIINILLLPQIIKWFENLSYDSFLTIFETNFSEILFYIQTLYYYLIPDKQNILLFLIFIFFYKNFIFIEKIFFIKNLNKNIYRLLLIILKYLISFPHYDISIELKNREKVEKNFDNSFIINKEFKQSDLDVFIYLGESTSSMNMSLYGYFRI